MFAEVGESTAGFGSKMSNFLDMHGATIQQDAFSVLRFFSRSFKSWKALSSDSTTLNTLAEGVARYRPEQFSIVASVWFYNKSFYTLLNRFGLLICNSQATSCGN